MSESEHNPPANPMPVDFARFGSPGFVIRWDAEGRVTRKVECLRVGQLALHENMLFVLEGDNVRGIIRLGDLLELRIEMRRSFRHPVIGSILGIVLILAAIPAFFLGDSSFCGNASCVAGPFFLFLGSYTLYEVVTSRMLPWLIARNGSHVSTHALERPLSEQESALLAALSPQT